MKVSKIILKSNSSITDCYFENNSIYTLCDNFSGPDIYGGTIYANDDGSVMAVFSCSNCKFINHTLYSYVPVPYAYGGTMCTRVYSKIENCEFVNSTIIRKNKEKGYSNGGALYMQNGTLKNCSFMNCVAKRGSEIYYYQKNTGYSIYNDFRKAAFLNVTNCVFMENINRDFTMQSVFYFDIFYNSSTRSRRSSTSSSCCTRTYSRVRTSKY